MFGKRRKRRSVQPEAESTEAQAGGVVPLQTFMNLTLEKSKICNVVCVDVYYKMTDDSPIFFDRWGPEPAAEAQPVEIPNNEGVRIF